MERMSVPQLQRGVRTFNNILYINWSKHYVCAAQFGFLRTTTLITAQYDLKGNLYKSQCY